MAETKAQIGLIGLAVMGVNFARNLASKKISTVVYNRTTEKMEALIKEHGSEYLFGEADLENFINSIEKPRKIILLIKAGPAVDALIKSLTPLLDKGDTIIDFGNSNYHDTKRRFEALEKDGLNFFGCGISGGEEGALHGPSLMPGGTESIWDSLRPILEPVAAKDFQGSPCVTYVGHGPAGHYVKMVHNGIEYGIMQIIAEAYEVLRSVYSLEAPQIADIFNKLNQGKLNSYLVEIAAKIFAQKDEFQVEYTIDYILDKAGQKGTGAWTSLDALERGVAVPTIAEAVFARVISSDKLLRKELNEVYKVASNKPEIKLEEFVGMLESGLYAANIIIYSQGLDLITKTNAEENWSINLAEITRIWQGGCIIRAKLLDLIHREYKLMQEEHMLLLPEIIEELKENIDNLRKLTVYLAHNSIPSHCLSSTLSYFDGITRDKGSANVIQGLRDYFGAHTYERIDKEGSFHTQWQ